MFQTQSIDIYCVDLKGQEVCVELKYPLATGSVVGQLLKYREDIKARTGGKVPRCFLVCPTIPDKVKENLQRNSMEWRELSMDEGPQRPSYESQIAPIPQIPSRTGNIEAASSDGPGS